MKIILDYVDLVLDCLQKMFELILGKKAVKKIERFAILKEEDFA